MTKAKNPTPPDGCGVGEWGEMYDHIVVGPEEIKNPYAHTGRLGDPTKSTVKTTRVMGFLTPTDQFIPIGSIPVMCLRTLMRRSDSVHIPMSATSAEDLVSVILESKLGSVLSPREIFRRDTLDPLEKYHRENPKHICPLKGSMYVDQTLNNRLYCKLYRLRQGTSSSFKDKMLDQSLIGDIWREPDSYTFGGDLLEGVTIKSIALTPTDEMARVYVQNAVGVQNSISDRMTRFAGIRVIDDESMPGECFCLVVWYGAGAE